MAVQQKAIALSVLLGALTSFNCAAAELYKISASLAFKGQPFGMPSALVIRDTPASIEMSGAERYKFSFTVTDIGPNEMKVETSVDSQHGAFSPTVVVRPGEPATVSEGDMSLTLTVDRTGS